MSEKELQEALEKAQKEINRLQAKNTSLWGAGKVNREAKNSVFLDLFGRSEYLIQLYRVLHPDDTEVTEEDIAVVTIENVLTEKPFNDMGIMVGRKDRKLVILAEAQSRWSTNVLFRLWQYIVDTLMNYFVNNGYNIYSTPKLEMPDVEAYIIYSGKSIPRILSSGRLETDEAGRYILSLNKEFFGGEKGKPELLAKVIYVKNGTGIIEEYIRFSQLYDEHILKCETEQEKTEAIKEIFGICEKENILTEYLKQHRSEVEKIMMTMVSPEYIEKAEAKTKAIRGCIEGLRAFGISEEEIKKHLVQKYHITPGYAQNCLDADWEDED